MLILLANDPGFKMSYRTLLYLICINFRFSALQFNLRLKSTLARYFANPCPMKDFDGVSFSW